MEFIISKLNNNFRQVNTSLTSKVIILNSSKLAVLYKSENYHHVVDSGFAISADEGEDHLLFLTCRMDGGIK